MALPSSSYESALTAETVPMPPASAHAPEDIWLVALMPLPPSISGRTSRPPIRTALSDLNMGLRLSGYFPKFCNTRFAGQRRGASRTQRGQNSAVALFYAQSGQGCHDRNEDTLLCGWVLRAGCRCFSPGSVPDAPGLR